MTLCDPNDYTIHEILQARILEWVAIPFSRGSPQPRDQTQVFCIAGGFFTSWATREAPQESLEFKDGLKNFTCQQGEQEKKPVCVTTARPLSCDFATPWTVARQAPLSITISQSYRWTVFYNNDHKCLFWEFVNMVLSSWGSEVWTEKRNRQMHKELKEIS